MGLGGGSVVNSKYCSSEDPSSIPCTHIRGLTTTCSPSSRGYITPLASVGTYIHVHKPYVHIIKVIIRKKL